MPTNRLSIEYNDAQVQFTVWDKDGVKHDATSIFSHLVVNTSTIVSNEITVGHKDNSTKVAVSFQALKKELTFDVSRSVVDQILRVLNP